VKARLEPLIAFLKALQPRAKMALAGASVLLVALVFATCGACRRAPAKTDTTTPSAGPVGSLSASAVRAAASAAGLDEPLKWQHARRGDAESLRVLALQEGPIGLSEAADREPTLRLIAINAMGYADGWATMPFLARSAAAKDDEEASAAMDSVLLLAARPRTSVDPEDADELAEGCTGLIGLAKDVGKPRARRVNAVRALRMMPCPKPEDIPTDIDAK
jgi:hypothetical protein